MKNLPNTAMIFGAADVHLLGKIMDEMDDEALKDLGFTRLERVRAQGVFEDLDRQLNRTVSRNWNEVEVL